MKKFGFFPFILLTALTAGFLGYNLNKTGEQAPGVAEERTDEVSVHD